MQLPKIEEVVLDPAPFPAPPDNSVILSERGDRLFVVKGFFAFSGQRTRSKWIPAFARMTLERDEPPRCFWAAGRMASSGFPHTVT